MSFILCLLVIIFRFLKNLMHPHERSRSFHSLDETSTQQDLRVLVFKFLTSSQTRHLEEVLIFDKPEIHQEIRITHPMVIYIHHESLQTKFLPIGTDTSKKWVKVDEEGFSLLAEIHPTFANENCQSFAISRLVDVHLTREKDFLRSTFITLRPQKNEPKPTKLKNQDVVKFGRQSFLVRLGEAAPKWYDRVYLQKEVLQGSCRICLSTEPTHERDFLISPCSCSGSLAHVHIECLKTWINNQVVNKKKEGVITYAYKKHVCEVCTSELPKHVSIHGHMIDLLPYDCDRNSLVLERIDFEGKGKVIHCIKFGEHEKKTIFIGRNDTNDIVLEDMSVSRAHAKIVINKTSIELYDLSSKYGTFVMLRSKISNLNEVSLMNGRWSFELSITTE